VLNQIVAKGLSIRTSRNKKIRGGTIMFIQNLNEMEEKEMVPGFFGRFIHTENMTLAYWRIAPGSVLPEHSHPQEQVVNLILGTLKLTVDGTEHTLRSGSVAIIPPDVPHSGRAVTDCRVIDVFYPVRDDYK